MRKNSKATAKPEKRASLGKHGGNRGGDQTPSADKSKRSNQAAGKEPQRGAKRR